MKLSNEWIFYLFVAGAVILNEIAGVFGVQIITLLPLLLIVLWAAFKFLPVDKSGE